MDIVFKMETRKGFLLPNELIIRIEQLMFSDGKDGIGRSFDCPMN